MALDLATIGGLTAVILVLVSFIKSVSTVSGRGTILLAGCLGVALSLVYLFSAEKGWTPLHILEHALLGIYAAAAAVGLKVGGAAVVDKMPTR